MTKKPEKFAPSLENGVMPRVSAKSRKLITALLPMSKNISRRRHKEATPFFSAGFEGKRVLILGLGLHGGGAGAASFFAKAGAEVIVTDLKTKSELKPALKRLESFKNISYTLGRHRASDVKKADIVVKNPGVPENSQQISLAKKLRIPIISDVEIFFELCPAPIIGITGTKGKSTAVWLLFKLLNGRAAWRKSRVWLGGNIQKSVLEFLPKIKKNDLVILELSSFQLDSLSSTRQSPHIAAITNIFPDHLNRYRDFWHYVDSKSAIFKFQKAGDYLFINKKDALLGKISSKAKSRRIFVDTERTIRPWDKIIGRKFYPHQQGSLAIALAIARFLGIDRKDAGAALRKIKPLAGRLEAVRKIRGITFINDTTATNPESAIAGLKAISKGLNAQKIVLIAGGSDKKLPVKDFAKAIRKFTKTVVFLPGKATARIKRELQSLKVKKLKGRIFNTHSMQEAVRRAYRLAERGDTVLLSPGAASFGLFQNEFDRGEQFVRAVNKLR